MQIVIDITEGHYKTLQAMSNIGLGYYYDAILNGTPLPKGHGRLIDEDVFREMLNNMPVNYEDKWFNWLQKESIRLASVPTIIEADNAESEVEADES